MRAEKSSAPRGHPLVALPETRSPARATCRTYIRTNRSPARERGAQAGARALSSRRGGEEEPGDQDLAAAAGDQHGVAESLQGSNGLGDEGGLLFDDGVIDGGAETFVEDLDAEQFGTGAGAVLIGAGDGDIEGQDLIGEPGSGWGSRTFYRGPPRCLLLSLQCVI